MRRYAAKEYSLTRSGCNENGFRDRCRLTRGNGNRSLTVAGLILPTRPYSPRRK